MRAFLLMMVALVGLSGCAILKDIRDRIALRSPAEASQTAAAQADPEAAAFQSEGEPRPLPRPDQTAGDAAQTATEPVTTEDTSVAETSAEKPAPDPNAKARAECLAKGGTFQRTGSSGVRGCVLRTRDANKSCSASSQCEGMCLARSGTCAPITPLFGCHDIVTNSGNMATVCID